VIVVVVGARGGDNVTGIVGSSSGTTKMITQFKKHYSAKTLHLYIKTKILNNINFLQDVLVLSIISISIGASLVPSPLTDM